MSGRKGGGLLLLLAIPLVIYVAWHVKGVVRADMVVSDVPADRGATKEQLTESKNKATKWAAETRKATEVALQYRQPEKGDVPADASAAEVVKTAAARAADLTDLNVFLTGVENPTFIGKLKEEYRKWKIEADKARELARGVTDWLARPMVVTSAADATRAMKELDALLNAYVTGSSFSSRREAVVWRIRGRLAVIRELSARADAQYPAAVAVPLPLKPDNETMKNARDTLGGVKNQVTLLQGNLQQAEEEKADLTSLRAEIDDRLAVAAKCSAREKLLNLFARDDLFTNPAGSTAWLREVADQYRGTKDEGDKKHIRKKVQEFCEAFLPAVVRLDDEVLFKDKHVKRRDVVIEYEPAVGAQTRSVGLSELLDSADKPDEFNAANRYHPKTTEVRLVGSSSAGRLDDLRPTDHSKAAKLYITERKAVPPGITGPKWTAKSVEELKKKCEAQKDLVDKLDKLKLPRAKGDKSPDDELKILARLEGLLEGLKACSDLLDGQ